MSVPHVKAVDEGGGIVVFSLTDSPSAKGNRALAGRLSLWAEKEKSQTIRIQTIVPLQTQEGVTDLIIVLV